MKCLYCGGANDSDSAFHSGKCEIEGRAILDEFRRRKAEGLPTIEVLPDGSVQAFRPDWPEVIGE